MIRKPENWNEVKEFTERPKLPLDAYVCKVKKAVVRSTDYGDQLCIAFDIAEGDYKDYFHDEFENNSNEDKKWKGTLRIWLPKNDGNPKDETTKSIFKGVITSFEKSNPGFTFNWDENSLAGKWVGVLFRLEEWAFNGRTGWAVKPFKAISVDSVRSGNFSLPKEKPLSGNNAVLPVADYSIEFTQVDSEDLPF